MVNTQPSREETLAAMNEHDEHVMVEDHPLGQRCGCGWAGAGSPGDTFDEHRFVEVLKAAAAVRPGPDLDDDNLDVNQFPLPARDALVAATLRFMTGRGYTLEMPGVAPTGTTSDLTGIDRLAAAVHFLDYVADIENLAEERATNRYMGLVSNAAGVKSFVMGAPNVHVSVTDQDRAVVRSALAGTILNSARTSAELADAKEQPHG
jgi:hypothetical protein